jgi:archaellum component FlaC
LKKARKKVKRIEKQVSELKKTVKRIEKQVSELTASPLSGKGAILFAVPINSPRPKNEIEQLEEILEKLDDMILGMSNSLEGRFKKLQKPKKP